MIDKQTTFEIHRLSHLGWSYRKIARTLGIAGARSKITSTTRSESSKKAQPGA